MEKIIIIILNYIFSIIFLTHSFFISIFLYRKNLVARPWVYGFFNNIYFSYRKYSPKQRFDKLKNIFSNPFIGWQYFCILKNKQNVEFIGNIDYPLKDLKSQHSINECFLLRKSEDFKISEISNGIIVDNIIHDGHHRIEIAKRLGITSLKLEVYRTRICI